MTLTYQQETLEYELKVAQMQADIDLKQAQSRKVKQDWRLDPTRVIIQAVIGTAAIMGAVGTVLGFFIGRGH